MDENAPSTANERHKSYCERLSLSSSWPGLLWIIPYSLTYQYSIPYQTAAPLSSPPLFTPSLPLALCKTSPLVRVTCRSARSRAELRQSCAHTELNSRSASSQRAAL